MTNDILLGWNAPSWATPLLNLSRRYMVDNGATFIWNMQLAHFGEQ
jgi:hypothetical protein